MDWETLGMHSVKIYNKKHRQTMSASPIIVAQDNASISSHLSQLSLPEQSC